MSFQTSISGLNAANAELNVTGNNIANASTTGFKESRAEFADVYAVSNLGLSSNTIGQGVQLDKVAQQFKQGTLSSTNNSLDLAINGQGFFTLDDNGSRLYTRAGAFGVDQNGYVVNASGQKLVGYQAANGTIIGAAGPLKIDASNIPPQATANVTMGVNLNSADPILTPAFSASNPQSFNNQTSLSVFDSLGGTHLARFYFKKTAANTWDVHLQIDGDATQTTTTQTLSFDNSGHLTTAMPVSFGTYNPGNGAAPINLNVDLTGTTQVGAGFGVNSLSQDGYTTGQLTGVDVNSQGMVLAQYSNGHSRAQGQVMLSNFADPQGLKPASNSNWVQTSTSGPPLSGAPGSSTLGFVQSGALEQSNTDLSKQLVDMIIAQRNYQANAKMISTENAVTQTMINLR